MSILSQNSTSAPEEAAEASARDGRPITLVDHTRPGDAAAQFSDSDDQAAISRQTTAASSSRFSREVLRKELARRKYRKWQEEREDDDALDADGLKAPQKAGAAAAGDAADEQGGDGRAGDAEGSRMQRHRSLLERGKDRVKGLAGRKKAAKKRADGGAVVDVLYENQRGSFWFGIPLFSSNSLLPIDPAGWTDAAYEPSAVDITNAEVPDPQWEWAWSSWYVDMSRDVDEEGWQYSFMFGGSFSWHGTHPWFHSFVRRRRWLRKRVKKHPHAYLRRVSSQQRLRDAHHLTSEYFTIHSGRAKSPDSSLRDSYARSSYSNLNRLSRLDDEEPVYEEIRDIPTLVSCLRKAVIDREKIVAVRTFLDQGGEELYYLAEQMPAIMSQLVFQNSRRQLLAVLMRKFDIASDHRAEHQRRGEPEDEAESRMIDNLLRAVEVADEQCKRLEYWSDVRDMVRLGETLAATDDSAGWETHRWAGVDASGPQAQQHVHDRAHGHGHDDEGQQHRGSEAPGAFQSPSEETEASRTGDRHGGGHSETLEEPDEERKDSRGPGTSQTAYEEAQRTDPTESIATAGYDNDTFRAKDTPGTVDAKGKGKAE